VRQQQQASRHSTWSGSSTAFRSLSTSLCNMKIAAITTIYRRPLLTNIVLRHWAWLRDQLVFDLEIFTAVSPDDDPNLGMLSVPSCVTLVEAPNDPLGRKWNTVARKAAGIDPDALLVFGSDDLVSAGYLNLVASLVEYGHDYVEPDSCHFYDAASGKCSELTGAMIGAGRTFSRGVLEAVPHLWGEVHRSPDHNQATVLRDAGFLPYRIRLAEHHTLRSGRPVIMDVKTDVHRWPFRDFTPTVNPQCQWADGQALLDSCFPTAAEAVPALMAP